MSFPLGRRPPGVSLLNDTIGGPTMKHHQAPLLAKTPIRIGAGRGIGVGALRGGVLPASVGSVYVC